jgi:transposase
MAKSKKILVKESEEELRKLKNKQPSHLKKRIEMLLVLKKSEEPLSKTELSNVLKINQNTAQTWRDMYFKDGLKGLLVYGKVGFKPSLISPELHKALEAKLKSPKDAFTSYVDLIAWITDNYMSEGINYQTINSYVKRNFKAKLKVARKSHLKKDENAVESFKKTFVKS